MRCSHASFVLVLLMRQWDWSIPKLTDVLSTDSISDSVSEMILFWATLCMNIQLDITMKPKLWTLRSWGMYSFLKRFRSPIRNFICYFLNSNWNSWRQYAILICNMEYKWIYTYTQVGICIPRQTRPPGAVTVKITKTQTTPTFHIRTQDHVLL